MREKRCVLGYSCTWSKNRKNTWSGTGYFLYEALKSKAEVIDCNTNLTGLSRLRYLLQKYLLGRMFRDKDSQQIEWGCREQALDRKLSNVKADALIQLDDIKSKKEIPYYIYQDASIDSLLWVKNEMPESFRYSAFSNMPEKTYENRRKYQQEYYKEAAGIFTMSHWLAENLIQSSRIPLDKVHYVGAGVNQDVTQVNPRRKRNNKILFIGRDFLRKGGDLVYEAFKQLRKEQNVELYVIGPREWPMSDKAEGLVFLGDLDYQHITEYLNLCDIFCMPSRFEPYGIVFAEALIFGLPCIGRNCFEMGNFIENGVNGYLINKDDPQELAKKMKDLLSNEKIKEAVRSKRESYIETYSWTKVAERMIHVIEADLG